MTAPRARANISGAPFGGQSHTNAARPRSCARDVTTTAKKTLVLVGLGVVVAGVVLWQVLRMTRPRPFTVRSARIAALDVATRSGEIEFIHPKSGRRTTVTARNIPPDCEITIDGRPADVSELRVGDAVAVRGLFYPYDQSARPQAVYVTRTSPVTQPTTNREAGRGAV